MQSSLTNEVARKRMVLFFREIHGNKSAIPCPLKVCLRFRAVSSFFFVILSKQSDIKFPRFITCNTVSLPSCFAKLMYALQCDDFKHIIAWSIDGLEFYISDRAAFEQTVIPVLFFKPSGYESFARKLLRWGFTKVRVPSSGHNNGISGYSHPQFRRGDFALCKLFCWNKSDGSAKNTSDEEAADILASLSTTSRVFSPKHQGEETGEESPASVSFQRERRCPHPHIVLRSYTSPCPIQNKGERIAFRPRPHADLCEKMITPTSILRRATAHYLELHTDPEKVITPTSSLRRSKTRHLELRTDSRQNMRMMILKRQHYLLGVGTNRSNGGDGRKTSDRSTVPHNQGTAPQSTFANGAIHEQAGHSRQPHLRSILNPIAGIPSSQQATATPAVQHSMFGQPASEDDADSVHSLHVTINRALSARLLITSSSLTRTLIHQHAKRKRTIYEECLQNSSSYNCRHPLQARRISSKNYAGCGLEVTREGQGRHEAARKNHIIKEALAVLQHPCGSP